MSHIRHSSFFAIALRLDFYFLVRKNKRTMSHKQHSSFFTIAQRLDFCLAAKIRLAT